MLQTFTGILLPPAGSVGKGKLPRWSNGAVRKSLVPLPRDRGSNPAGPAGRLLILGNLCHDPG
jgi:hypothetical protein